MTREEFIETLERNRYSYEIVGDKIVVTHRTGIYLSSLKTLPPGVEFENRGYVSLRLLKTLPPGVEFNNLGDVFLSSLKTLPRVVEFKNGGNVFLESLETLSPGVEFKNGGNVFLNSLIGGESRYWSGNIEGISPNRLLNKMIEYGLFDRR